MVEVFSLHVLHEMLPIGVRRRWWNLPSMSCMLFPMNKRKLIRRHMARRPYRVPSIMHSNTIRMSIIYWMRYRETVERAIRLRNVCFPIFWGMMVHCITNRLATPRCSQGLIHRVKWVVFHTL